MEESKEFSLTEEMRLSKKSIFKMVYMNDEIAKCPYQNIVLRLGHSYISPALYPLLLSAWDVALAYNKNIKIYYRKNTRSEELLHLHGVLDFYNGNACEHHGIVPYQEVLLGDATPSIVEKIAAILPTCISDNHRSILTSKLYEVLINAIKHSKSDSSVKMNAYVDGRRFHVSVYDSGVGIPANVKEFFNNQLLDDVDAMKWALEDGNSTAGNIGTVSRGVGLGMIERFVKDCNGKMFLGSGNCLYYVNKNSSKFERLDCSMLGTFFTIQVNIDNKE